MLTRSIIIYELLFDYEFLHMQLKRAGRFILTCIRYCQRSRYRCPIQCAVHTRDYMTVNRQQNYGFFLLRWIHKLEEYLVEKQIQSTIITHKTKKHSK